MHIDQLDLPDPDPALLAQSQELAVIIREQITRGDGAIGFDEYMHSALYQPRLGYYPGGAHKIGGGGDFQTAPELSSLFSRCLARQCAELLAKLDGGHILELGAGSGRMAVDVLQELEELQQLPGSYLILEPSPDLQQRQQQLLKEEAPQHLSRVSWLNALPEPAIKAVVLANEVLDAMPVKRFRMSADGVQEMCVAYSEGKFEWYLRRPGADQKKELDRILRTLIEPLPEGCCFEINMALAPWLRSLADSLQSGVMLMIDYGYPRREFFHPQRSAGTLVCHYQQRAHTDPFFLPGGQDISSSVEFTALAEAGLAAGLRLAGFTTQASFLLACGIENMVLEQKTPGGLPDPAITSELKRLTLPAEMGEKFKVMALSKQYDHKLAGFSFIDNRHRL